MPSTVLTYEAEARNLNMSRIRNIIFDHKPKKLHKEQHGEENADKSNAVVAIICMPGAP